MLFQMKIQPIDSSTPEDSISNEPVKPAVTKSRFKRLFERQFPNILRSSSSEKVGIVVIDEPYLNKNDSGEFDPSSVSLANMVLNFIEDSNEKQSTAVKCARNRSNCFNGNCNDSSDEELDGYGCFGEPNFAVSGEACEILKSLVPCATVCERNLLADAAKIVDKNKICKRKDSVCRKIVTDGLLALGYNASICKSRWDKSTSFPAGEYEYVDVIVEGERLLIDIDFQSEFEIARSTKAYKTILQTLPYIFVGKADRLQRIIGIVTDAAKQSLKKKGMHFPPWRKAEYVRAKWFSSYTRTSPPPTTVTPPRALTLTTDASHETPFKSEKNQLLSLPSECESAEKNTEFDDGESVFVLSYSSGEEEGKKTVAKEWKPPAIKPKMNTSQTGVKIFTGLASFMEDKP